MRKHAQRAVHPRLRLVRSFAPVERLQPPAHPAKRLVRRIRAVRLHVRPQELHAPARVDHANLRLVQFKFQFVAQELPRLRYDAPKLLLGRSDHIRIVDVASVMPALELALHEVVERAEVDVAEELRREVADRQTASWPRVEERLLLRQQLPFVPVADDPAVRHRIEHADGFQKVVDQGPIQFTDGAGRRPYHATPR